MQNIPVLNQIWLINSRSGNGRGAELLRSLQGIPGVAAFAINFANLGDQITSAPHDALVVVAGGDGTFSAVLGHRDIRTRKVACIPLGTANDLAREMGIASLIRGKSWTELPSTIAALPSIPFALWTVNADGKEYPLANYVSIGFEGAVVQDFAKWRATTKLTGKLANRIAYALFGLRRCAYTIPGASLRCDNSQEIPCAPTTGLIVTNIKSHLGLGLSNAQSSSNDGTIECVSVSSVLGFLSMMAASVGLARPPRVLAHGHEISIAGIPEGTPMQIDGEAYGSVSSGKLHVLFRHFVSLCHAT